MHLSHYDQLAAIFDYPRATYLDDVARLAAELTDSHPRAAEALEAFLARVPHDDLDELQELYTRTFEVQAIATLDVGYTLFGDDYKRGALLANLNGEHRKANNDCITELADHLPNVLRLLPRLRDQELLEEMVTELVAPAVRRMIIEFDSDRLAQKDLLYRKHYKTVIATAQSARTAYGDALRALFEVLREDFTLKAVPQVERTSPFLLGIGTEMHTEACNECSSAALAKP